MSDQLSLELGSAQPDAAPRREVIEVWFDGASRGNGSVGARASIGGVVVDGSSGEELATVSAVIGEQTNNVAEYQALIATLRAAAPFGARTVRILGDSALVVNQLAGRWKVKASHLLPLLREAQRAIRDYEVVEFAHVPRAQNARADALANHALDGAADAR